MKKTTSVEFNHETMSFSVVEEDTELGTLRRPVDIWRAVQILQMLNDKSKGENQNGAS